jgi:hypothetical protein
MVRRQDASPRRGRLAIGATARTGAQPTDFTHRPGHRLGAGGLGACGRATAMLTRAEGERTGCPAPAPPALQSRSSMCSTAETDHNCQDATGSPQPNEGGPRSGSTRSRPRRMHTPITPTLFLGIPPPGKDVRVVMTVEEAVRTIETGLAAVLPAGARSRQGRSVPAAP